MRVDQLKYNNGTIARWLRLAIHFLGNILRSVNIFFYRLNGIEIGHNTMISLRAKLDVRRGQISIGNNCIITYGCILVSHDAAASIINPEDDGAGSILIEDNVYIGVGSIILRNVRIGRNAIIGAGSLIIKDIPANAVVIGNPQRIVKIIGEEDVTR